jgi:hypothetical protein
MFVIGQKSFTPPLGIPLIGSKGKTSDDIIEEG